MAIPASPSTAKHKTWQSALGSAHSADTNARHRIRAAGKATGTYRFALLALVLLVAQPLLAKTYYVGTCKTGAYSTIGAAVAAVPAGSTIEVCPGTYPEQVVISQPLTLKGIVVDNSSQAVIAVPSGGLVTTTSVRFGTIAAQIELTAGPVNITGITVDGTASSSNCPSVKYAAIFYASGSSGAMNEVETRNQNCSSVALGMGVLAENGAGTTQSVTIENNNVNSNTYIGIYACSDQTPSTLSAYIKGNYVASVIVGIVTDCNVTGSVSGNFVQSGVNGAGIQAGSPSSPISGNTVIGGQQGIILLAPAAASTNIVNGSDFGISVYAAGSVTSNQIVNTSYTGVFILSPGATVKTNAITQTPYGIDFNCKRGTVSGNTINGAGTGLAEVPAGFTGVNNFYNVATLTTGCS